MKHWKQKSKRDKKSQLSKTTKLGIIFPIRVFEPV